MSTSNVRCSQSSTLNFPGVNFCWTECTVPWAYIWQLPFATLTHCHLSYKAGNIHRNSTQKQGTENHHAEPGLLCSQRSPQGEGFSGWARPTRPRREREKQVDRGGGVWGGLLVQLSRGKEGKAENNHWSQSSGRGSLFSRNSTVKTFKRSTYLLYCAHKPCLLSNYCSSILIVQLIYFSLCENYLDSRLGQIAL